MKGQVDWFHDDFITLIDGVRFRIITERNYDGSFDAMAYIPQGAKLDSYCTSVTHKKSIEIAILDLVKKIETKINQ